MKLKNSSWNDFYIQGIQYMHAAEKSIVRGDVFTPVIIYNISAIAIEKLIMGACMSAGELPLCHSLSGMADFAKNVIGLDQQLVDDMNLMDKMQMLCSADDISVKDPEIEDIPFFIDVMKRIFEKTELHIRAGK